MSRIGRMPIAVPAGVTVDIAENNKVTVKGPKGTLERVLPAEMDIKLDGDTITVSRPNDLKKMKSLHGLTRTLIHNMVVGVTEGYKKELEVNGVGYRAQKQGNKLVLALGYSHPVEMVDPDGIETSVDGNKIIVSGISKEKVGQYAAEIREKRAPEPYKGKGIKYVDETIRRKVGMQHGAGLGRTLGVPTINQLYPQGFQLPRFGIYITRTKIGDVWYPSATGLGTRPTVNNDPSKVTCETFIPGFSGDLYGTDPVVEFHAYLSPSKKFDTLDELKACINHAAERAQAYFRAEA